MIDINKLLGGFYSEFEQFQLKKIKKYDNNGTRNVKTWTHARNNDLLKHSTAHADGDGWWLEFGVHTGKTISYITTRYTELHPVVKNKQIYGFDSFEGLPEDWDLGSKSKGVKTIVKKGAFNLHGEIPQRLRKNPNITPIKGWFKDSLPKFLKENKDGNSKVSFLHMDADLYSSTKTVLTLLTPYFRGNCVIVFDEFSHYVNAGEGEYKAFKEFLEENKDNILNVRAIGKDWRDQSVSFLITFKNK